MGLALSLPSFASYHEGEGGGSGGSGGYGDDSDSALALVVVGVIAYAVYKNRNKFEAIELKEFSILFLILNNFHIFRKNIELISEIDFSKNIFNELKQKLIDCSLSENFSNKKTLSFNDFDGDFKDIINLINTNAPVKIICKNKNEEEIISIFNEIIGEIKKISLSKKIESLEDKISLNLDEKLYSELLSLRNQLKGG